MTSTNQKVGTTVNNGAFVVLSYLSTEQMRTDGQTLAAADMESRGWSGTAIVRRPKGHKEICALESRATGEFVIL